MGIIEWGLSKITKKFNIEGVKLSDLKILLKYIPFKEISKLNITEDYIFNLYKKAKKEDILRLVSIIKQNKNTIINSFKKIKIDLSEKGINSIIKSLEKIVNKENKEKYIIQLIRKIAKYIFKLKDIKDEDITTIKKYLPINHLQMFTTMDQRDFNDYMFDIYMQAEVPDLQRLVDIIKTNRDAFVGMLRNTNLEISKLEIPFIISDLNSIIEIKSDEKNMNNKSLMKRNLENKLKIILDTLRTRHPHWFEKKSSYREDIVLRF